MGAAAELMRTRPARAALVAAGLAMLVGTVAFGYRWSWATDLWPWPDSKLSYVFIASILAAIAVPTIWIGLSGELGAIEAGAIDLTVTYVGILVYLITIAGDPGQPALGAYIAVFAAAAASTIAVLAVSSRLGLRDPRPMPALVRAWFAFFAAVLVAVSAALLAHVGVFPWPLRPESSRMFGLIFLGAAAYFVHGLIKPSWANATGQLAGFLAYDLVLIVPFIRHFHEVHGTKLVSLVIYTAVLVASGALAIVYLFVRRETRVWPRAVPEPNAALT
jgi:hypothetical protein